MLHPSSTCEQELDSAALLDLEPRLKSWVFLARYSYPRPLYYMHPQPTVCMRTIAKAVFFRVGRNPGSAAGTFLETKGPSVFRG